MPLKSGKIYFCRKIQKSSESFTVIYIVGIFFEQIGKESPIKDVDMEEDVRMTTPN